VGHENETAVPQGGDFLGGLQLGDRFGGVLDQQLVLGLAGEDDEPPVLQAGDGWQRCTIEAAPARRDQAREQACARGAADHIGSVVGAAGLAIIVTELGDIERLLEKSRHQG
jgi:hypothetical protein